MNGRADGHGLFAAQLIEPGEVLVVWGGQVVERELFGTLPAEIRTISLQIEEDLFLAPTAPSGADRVNHSCEPNAGLRGPITLVAMRYIQPGEEICYDYATSDGTPYDEFECRCGAAACRRRVTGDDWRNPALWDRYDGYFSPYLAQRITALSLRATRPVRSAAR